LGGGPFFIALTCVEMFGSVRVRRGARTAHAGSKRVGDAPADVPEADVHALL
jgi:hypothetical protein